MEGDIYTMNYLVNRVYEKLSENENFSSKSKMVMEKPNVMFANKKTTVTNFRNICNKIKRKELDVKNFFDSELSTKTSIDASGSLIANGRFRQDGIQKILVRYMKEFVICKECSSHNNKSISEIL
jgi:translation initiation factor 2 subunit 2